MACAQGTVELPDDEESRPDLPAFLEAEHGDQGAQEPQNGRNIIFYTCCNAEWFCCVLCLIYGQCAGGS
jgi:hypothetical protein